MLTTRCPSCGTTFRVRPEQLTARNGRVRCGKCQTAFSALASLEEMDDGVPTAASTTPQASTITETPREASTTGGPAIIYPPAEEPVAEPVGLDLSTVDFDLNLDLEDDSRIEPAPPAEWLSTSSDFEAELKARSAADMSAPPPVKPAPATPAFDIDFDATPENDRPDFVAPHAVQPEEPPADSEPIVVHGLEPEFDLDVDHHESELPATEEGIEPMRVEPSEPSAFVAEPAQAPEEAVEEASTAAATVAGGPGTIFLNEEVTPPLIEEARKPSIKQRLLWALIFVVLLVVALAVGAYVFRTDLARAYPALRAPLEQACANLGCDVPFPRDAKLIAVEGTDLIPEQGAAGRYRLVVTLRNRADYPQSWPQLELTLTDRFDRALSRRVIPPREWLPKEQAARPAFEAQGEVTANVPISTDLPAAGYRVYAFYP